MDKIEELIRRYNAGECSAEEKKWLEQWYQSFEWNNKADGASDTGNNVLKEDVWESLRQSKPSFMPETQVYDISTASSSGKWWRYAAAAVLFFAIGGIIYYMNRNPEKKNIAVTNASVGTVDHTNALPGTSRAQLVLGDGSVITLDSARSMQIREKDGTLIDKRSGSLVYNDQERSKGEVLYNILSTPRGGEYQLMLPDGSKVWLNAASSIKFPTRFEGKDRIVFLHGEAYFEVARNKEMPFQVKMDNDMTVQVLGTHFNIMGYDDEAEVKTTLAEGIVKVTNQSNSVLLSPAKQAVLKKKDQSLAVSNADVTKAIAWKNGMIEFDGDDLPYIMRQLARWYDVDVSFVGTTPKGTYQGAIRRQSPLLKVLEILRVAGVRYKMEGKRLIVTGG